MEKQYARHEVLRTRVQETGLPVVYANLVGGQDELVFDGASFVLDAAGVLTHRLPEFEEALGLVEFADARPLPGEVAADQELEASVYQALCLGVRDYVNKNGFPGVVLGLSGGVDSALTLAIAVDALGAERVRTVMMPSQYTAPISQEDAAQMARNLGVHYTEIPIGRVYDSFLGALAGEFDGRPFDLTEENLQARIRGTLLMALSNKFGSIVLTTGNKSEMGVGYSTLYGDMAGGFSVIKDVPKTLVYQVCRFVNRSAGRPLIPSRVLTKPPTAELRPHQKDSDSLPPYPVLDPILKAYVEDDKEFDEMLGMGFDRETVERVIRLVDLSEYKRRQAPPGVKITARSLGKDRRFPITNRYKSY
jgi:NAD+ synthetase